jgi:hypothetical protein
MHDEDDISLRLSSFVVGVDRVVSLLDFADVGVDGGCCDFGGVSIVCGLSVV